MFLSPARALPPARGSWHTFRASSLTLCPVPSSTAFFMAEPFRKTPSSLEWWTLRGLQLHAYCPCFVAPFCCSYSQRCPKGTSLLPGGQVVQVAGGGMHSAALTASGEVYTTGVNDEGALGRETSSRPPYDLDHWDKACGTKPVGTLRGCLRRGQNGHEVRVLCMHHQHRVQFTV